jgi:hypothetical protein
MWIKTNEFKDEELPRCKSMTGLDQEQVLWIYNELKLMIEWEKSTGRPRAMSLLAALVMVFFTLRQNLSFETVGEIFGCSGSTVENYIDELEVLVDDILTPLYDEIREQAHREAVLVDGLVVPVGERFIRDDLFSGKKHINGMNVQYVCTLAGIIGDVGDPCPGSMHDSRAFEESGIAVRWADHYKPDGLGMTGDKGYQGTGINTPYKKPRGKELTEVRKSCNSRLNSIRAAVERGIAHFKCWKILKTGYHRSLTDFSRVLLLVTKLEMFRIYG